MTKKKKRPLCKNCGKEVIKNPNVFCDLICQILYKLDKSHEKIENGESVADKIMKRYLVTLNPCCHTCGIHSWMNKPLMLELDHIDGDCTNTTLQNCRLLCPNCHSQTPTFRAKNTNNPLGKEGRALRYKK